MTNTTEQKFVLEQTTEGFKFINKSTNKVFLRLEINPTSQDTEEVLKDYDYDGEHCVYSSKLNWESIDLIEVEVDGGTLLAEINEKTHGKLTDEEGNFTDYTWDVNLLKGEIRLNGGLTPERLIIDGTSKNVPELELNGEIIDPSIFLGTKSIELEINNKYFVNYNEESHPKVRVYGNVANLVGVVKPIKSISGSTKEYKICTLPSRYIPECSISQICQGSGGYKWLCRINNESGDVTFSRYGATSNSSYANANKGAWLPFNITWIC